MVSEPSDMEAIILCGGYGSRLTSISGNHQKTSLVIGGKPFINIIIEWLFQNNINRILLAAGYRSEDIHKAVEKIKISNLKLKIITEKKKLGTGGAILNATKQINTKNFLVCNGDSFFPIQLNKLLSFHNSKNSDVTIALGKQNNRTDVGFIEIDENFRVLSFKEKNKQLSSEHSFVNGGVYILKKSSNLSQYFKKVCSFEEEVLPNILHKNIYGNVFAGIPLDIGTPERFKKIDEMLRKKN